MRKRKIVITTVVIRPNFTLLVTMIRQHGVVQGYTALGCMALALLLVIIDAVDIDDSLVVLLAARVTVHLEQSRVRSSLNLLGTIPAIHSDLLFTSVMASELRVPVWLHKLLLRWRVTKST